MNSTNILVAAALFWLVLTRPVAVAALLDGVR